MSDYFTAPRFSRVACWVIPLVAGSLSMIASSGYVHAQSGQGMGNMPGMSGSTQTSNVSGMGTVMAVDPKNRKVTIEHEPISAMNWPAMKMEFSTSSSLDISKVGTGDKVRFTFSTAGNVYTVQSVTPVR